MPKYTVNVKATGSNNTARVLGQGISANSTNSPATAVSVAANKLCARLGIDRQRVTFLRVTGSLGAEVWEIEVHP